LGHDHRRQDARRSEHGPDADVFAEDESCPDERQQGLEQLDLSDFGHAAAGEAGVPGEEAEEHGDDRDVGEAEPRGRLGVQARRRGAHRGERNRHRK
jgi:hypothetical protein